MTISESVRVPIEQPDDWTEPGAYPVADGVWRIPLPLPGDGLRAVNVYAIRDGAGLVLVDGGWALAAAENLLVDALGTLGAGLGDIHRFLITHAHRDHYTQAVAIRRRFGTPIALGIGDRPSVEHVADRTRPPLRAQISQLYRLGGAELADRLRAAAAARREPVDWEPPDEWLDGETTIGLASRSLAAVPTPGHTSGHFVFVDAAGELLFAGDHVLPHITPSIGFEPEPAALPLESFLTSLAAVRRRPDLRLLPAHGPTTESVHARIDELVTHHDRRLAASEAVVRGGASTAFAAAHVLRWTRRERHFDDLDPFNQMLAACETAAHLDLLAARGRLTRSEVDGVVHYAAT